MNGRVRTGKASRLLAIVLVAGLALVGTACGSGSGATANPGANSAGCENWCGNGSARVTAGGATTTITGGGCYDQGAGGIDARFGDWGDGGTGDYLAITGYRAGGPTPTPAPTTNAAHPSATDHANYPGDGSVGGLPFILDTGATITFEADGSGSFSGSDVNGAGQVSGSFSCS
jgi:hypothetical protein